MCRCVLKALSSFGLLWFVTVCCVWFVVVVLKWCVGVLGYARLCLLFGVVFVLLRVVLLCGVLFVVWCGCCCDLVCVVLYCYAMFVFVLSVAFVVL